MGGGGLWLWEDMGTYGKSRKHVWALHLPQPGLRHLLVTTVLYLRLSQAAPGASESLAGTAVEPDRKVGLGMR